MSKGAGMQCPKCERDSGLYDFTLLCCRVRYLASLHSKGQRAAQLNRWKLKHGERFANETLEGLKAWHNSKQGG